MPTIRILTEEEINRSFHPASKRAQREEEMKPYHEAVAQLGNGQTGGIIELDEGEEPRQAMMRLHRAARDSGKNIRFKRTGKGSTSRLFRLQTDEESNRLKEPGRRLAASRQSKSRPSGAKSARGKK